jgi:hypothetical protein
MPRIALLIAVVAGLTRAGTGQEATSLAELNLPRVQKEQWKFKGFPIMAWWPPSGTKTLKDFQRYKEAGFTIYPANPDAGFDNAIKLAEQVGLAVMPWRTRQGFDVPAHGRAIVFPESDPNVVAWITSDEPGGYARVIGQITAVNELMGKDGACRAFFNLFPPHHQKDPNTEQIVSAAVRNGMPVISYDNYVIMADGTDRTKQHFDNLARARALSLKHHVPFWTFALTTKHRDYRRPSESDVRWKQFTNLAYGAKGLWYFCYWGPHSWSGWDTRSIVDANSGQPTDLYYQVNAINHAVLDMGRVLLGLTSEAVAHTNPPDGHPRFMKGQYWIEDIKARDALIGFFRDGQGEPYAMVVNQLHGMNQSSRETTDTVMLTFGSAVKSVEAVNWLDGKTGMIQLKEGRASLTIAGGTGVLLRASLEKNQPDVLPGFPEG